MSNQIVKTKKLTLVAVKIEIASLNCHYPESGHTPDILEVISADWFEEFQGMNDLQFKGLIRASKRICKFFPKIADVQEEADFLRRNETIQPTEGSSRKCKECGFFHRKEGCSFCTGGGDQVVDMCQLFAEISECRSQVKDSKIDLKMKSANIQVTPEDYDE